MSISATEKPLGKIFTSDYRFVIPSFQRAYTWQTENIAQLVTDLQDACHDPDTPYFLGSLILVHDGQTKYQVIDGQQRLISLSIIISVLRDLEDDPELVESLNDLIVEPGDKLRGIKAEPRLKLRERDTNFFRMYVQEAIWRTVRSARQRYRIARATQHRHQHQTSVRRTRENAHTRPPRIRIIPRQRSHPRHRNHRRSRRRTPYFRRHEHARSSPHRIRRVQSKNHRRNLPRRTQRLRFTLGRHHGSTRRRRTDARRILQRHPSHHLAQSRLHTTT